MRWIVGDLQGCVRELERLLDTIRFDPARDQLWCAGDVVNRGPASLETLRLWHDVGARTVLGNHDLHALAVHAGKRRPRPKDTLDALLADPDADRLLDRLRREPALVHLPSDGDGPDAWLVHAGLHPSWHDLHALADRLESAPHDDAWLAREEVVYAATVRCCLADGTPLRAHDATCTPPHQPWDAYYPGPTLVVHGHWATRGHYRGRHTLGLDSGAVYGGPLTAWCQEEDRILQIPSTQPRR